MEEAAWLGIRRKVIDKRDLGRNVSIEERMEPVVGRTGIFLFIASCLEISSVP